MYGRCARGGQGPLVRRQYESDDELTPELRRSLKYMLALLDVVTPREIRLSLEPRPVVVLYTDASWEPGVMQAPGLGMLCFADALPRPCGAACTVPKPTLDAFQERETQIAPLEALAVLQASLLYKHVLRNCDILLFVDNQAVCSALVRGSSPSDDIAHIVALCHLLWASLEARVWLEYVPSADNPSDGLSRDGVADSWTVQQSWSLSTTDCLPWHQYHDTPLLEALQALLHWEGFIGHCSRDACVAQSSADEFQAARLSSPTQ